jgi:mannosyltransferase
MPRAMRLPVLLTLLAAILRLHGLGQQSFWSDEMHTVMMSGVPYGPEAPPWHPRDLLLVTQGPLFMGLVHAWSTVFGRSEAALRLLPCLFAVATVPLFFAFVARLLGRTAAGFATFLLAVSPFHVWYAQELRGYSLLILAAVLSALALDRVLDPRRGAPAHLAYAASLLTGLGASLTMGFLVPVHAAIALGARLRPRRLLAFAATLVLVMVVLLPWLGVFGERHDVGRVVDRPEVIEPPLRGTATLPKLAVPYAFYAFSVGFSLGPTPAELHANPMAAFRRHTPLVILVALAFGAVALRGAVGLAARRPRLAAAVFLWIGIPFLLAAGMAAANVKVWNARYVAVTYPAYVLLLGVGLAELRRPARILGLVILAGLSLAALAQLRFDPRYGKEDYRSAGAFLDRELAPSDVWIGVGAPAPILYYATHRPAAYVLLHPHRIRNDAELRRRVAAATEARGRAWLIRARAHQSDPENTIGAILAEARARAVQATFPGIEIERYDLPDDLPATPGRPAAAATP